MPRVAVGGHYVHTILNLNMPKASVPGHYVHMEKRRGTARGEATLDIILNSFPM
jgi:hypothetical protein